MVAKRVDDPADAPAIRLILYWPHFLGTGGYSFCERRVWILHNHDHSRRAARKGFWTEISIFRRLIGKPKLGSRDAELRND